MGHLTIVTGIFMPLNLKYIDLICFCCLPLFFKMLDYFCGISFNPFI